MTPGKCQATNFHPLARQDTPAFQESSYEAAMDGTTVGYNHPGVLSVQSRVGEGTMSQCRKFRVEGRVQGVWFRESTRQQAERLGITGYAINCRDGSVEVLACGESGALDALAKWLQRGPPMAQVRSVSVMVHAGDCPERFSTG
jgi:acylphosphatase